MIPTLTSDNETGAHYLRVSAQTVSSTTQVHATLFIDLDKLGNVVGIEYLPRSAYKSAESDLRHFPEY